MPIEPFGVEITPNKRGDRSLYRPLRSQENYLLQVGHRRQVNLI